MLWTIAYNLKVNDPINSQRLMIFNLHVNLGGFHHHSCCRWQDEEGDVVVDEDTEEDGQGNSSKPWLEVDDRAQKAFAWVFWRGWSWCCSGSRSTQGLVGPSGIRNTLGPRVYLNHFFFNFRLTFKKTYHTQLLQLTIVSHWGRKRNSSFGKLDKQKNIFVALKAKIAWTRRG